MSIQTITPDYWLSLHEHAHRHIHSQEYYTMELSAETSRFTRFNNSRIRQTGSVFDAECSLSLFEPEGENCKKTTISFRVSGNFEEDCARVARAIHSGRAENSQNGPTEFVTVPTACRPEAMHHFSPILREIESPFLDPEDSSELEALLMMKLNGVDAAGMFSSGRRIRAMATSAGASHWYCAPLTAIDYSLYDVNQNAVKQEFVFSNANEDVVQFSQSLETLRKRLDLLSKPKLSIRPGDYTTYIASDACSTLLESFAWEAFSEKEIQKRLSPMRTLRTQEKTLSKKFNIIEDFSLGFAIPFNERGEVAPDYFPIIQSGKLENTWISQETATEFHLNSNGATASESLRSPKILPGNTSEEALIAQIDEGIFVSRFHYCNFSSESEGRLTGLTRFGTFWVKNGKLVAPLGTLRFDDSIFRFWGTELVDFSQNVTSAPELGSYEFRSFGGVATPGCLLRSFSIVQS